MTATIASYRWKLTPDQMKKRLSLIGMTTATLVLAAAALAQAPAPDIQQPRSLAHPMLNSVIFAALGIIVVFVAFKIFDKATPKVNFQEELLKNNTAVAIVIGAVIIGISLIVAASIAG